MLLSAVGCSLMGPTLHQERDVPRTHVLSPPKIQPCVAAMAAVTVCVACVKRGVCCAAELASNCAGQGVYGDLQEQCTGAVLRVVHVLHARV